MECRIARTGEEAQLQALWQRCFEEEPAVAGVLFQRLYRPGRGLVLEEDGVIRSMLLSLPVELLDKKGNRRPASYVYAFCTHPEARGRGYGRALLRWAEEQAAERGDCAVIMVPGEEGLFPFYESLGYRRAFPRGTTALSPVPEGGTGMAERLSPQEYGALREELLVNLPHAAYEDSVLEAQEALCQLSGGGGLYAVTLGVLRCALAAECWPGEPVHIKELIAPKALHQSAAAVLCRALGREDCVYHAPIEDAKGWGVIKWLSENPIPELWFGLGLE